MLQSFVKHAPGIFSISALLLPLYATLVVLSRVSNLLVCHHRAEDEGANAGGPDQRIVYTSCQ